MTIRYSLQRTDVSEAYWHQWRSGWKLKAAQIVIASSVFYIALNWLNLATPVEAGHVAGAITIALATVACLPLYSLIRFKPQQRVLTITPDGIETMIANHAGHVPGQRLKAFQLKASESTSWGRTRTPSPCQQQRSHPRTSKRSFFGLAKMTIDVRH